MTPRAAAPGRRDDFLDAAARVFAAKGFNQAGIADIARDLGLGHGTFYLYFRSKQDVAKAVLARAVARIAAPALAQDPEAADTLAEYRDQVERLLRGMLALADDEPEAVAFFHGQSVAVDPRAVADAMDTYAAFTERFLINGVEKGFLRADLDTRTTAQQLLTILTEGTRRVLADPGDEDLRERWVAAGLALMFEGLT